MQTTRTTYPDSLPPQGLGALEILERVVRHVNKIGSLQAVFRLNHRKRLRVGLSVSLPRAEVRSTRLGYLIQTQSESLGLLASQGAVAHHSQPYPSCAGLFQKGRGVWKRSDIRRMVAINGKQGINGDILL